jgi:PST family polysaccharide transporter
MNIKDKVKKNKVLIENILSLSMLNALNILLPLISLPYILRVVGTSNYGKYSYVYVLTQYLLLITMYGFNYSATKQISQNRDSVEEVSKIYNSITACRLLLFIIGVLAVFSLQSLILASDNEKYMFLLGIGMVLGDIFTPVWLFQGLEKMRFMTIVNFVSKSIFTLLIFFAIRHSEDYVYIMVLNSCGYIIAGLLSTIIAKRKFKIHFFVPNLKDVKFQFEEGFALFGSAVGINLYTNASVFILKFFVNDSLVGIYSAAEKTIRGLKLLSSPISQAFFPHLGYRFKSQPVKESLKQLRDISKPFTLILVTLSIITFLFSNTLMKIVGGKEFMEGGLLIQIMSSTVVLGGLNSLLGVSGLVNLNRQKDFLLGVFVAGITCVGFLLIFIPFGGIKAAAWATVVSEIVLLTVIFSSFYKLNRGIS